MKHPYRNMINAALVTFTACFLVAHVTASCGCVCSETLVAQPYIVELANSGDCSRPEGPTGSQCFDVNCAKCGQSLECYVNTGSPATDDALCGIIKDVTKFCPVEKGKKDFTPCGQQCSGSEGVSCFPGESWGTCPAVLGSIGGTAKCKFGANGGPAALSNFASYTICPGTSGATCTADGLCSPDGSSYQCTVGSECVSSQAVTCAKDKCDTDTSTDGTCPCA